MFILNDRIGMAVLLAGFLFAGSFLAVPRAHAQDNLQDASFRFSAELNAGGAFYGHFLEQRRTIPPNITGGERELTAQTGLSLGAALGIRLFERNVVRLSLDYLPSQLEFQDDTGNGSDALDSGALADLQLFAVSVEAERTFFQAGRVAPYASVGLSGGLWSLDEEGPITAGSQETLFRWGGTSGLGARVRLTPHLALNLEANALSLGNPFDGAEAFRVGGAGETFEEPGSVRVLRVRGGLRYTF